MQRLTTEEFRMAEKMPLVVVLDNVRSMHNVGSVFRTCDAFRSAGIMLCGITAVPPQNEIHKTALGAEESVAWEYYKDTCDAVRRLHAPARDRVAYKDDMYSQVLYLHLHHLSLSES